MRRPIARGDFPELARRIGKALGYAEPVALTFGCDLNALGEPRRRPWIEVGLRRLAGDEIEAEVGAGIVRVFPGGDGVSWEIDTEEASMGAGTIRRAIARADEAEVRRRVAKIGGGRVPVVVPPSGRIMIDGWQGDSPPHSLRSMLATVGIFPGAGGWEIEVRRPLPKPWRWWKRGPYPYWYEFLAPSDCTSGCVAMATPQPPAGGGTPGFKVRRADRAPGMFDERPAASLEDAKARAEDECWSRGLLVVEDAQQGPAVPIADAAPHPRELEGVRLGVDPLSPALALRRLAMRLQPGESVDVIDRLCNDFVTALRASLPAPPMPLPRSAAACSDCAALNAECLRLAEQVAALRLESEGNDAALLVATTERNAYRAEAEALRERAARTTDGALTAYLVEHHSDAWRPGEDALALTIRLLGELTADRNAFAAEARTANVTADRLATTAATLRRERDDAQADLATLRKGVSELAAKMGAPHG